MGKFRTVFPLIGKYFDRDIFQENLSVTAAVNLDTDNPLLRNCRFFFDIIGCFYTIYIKLMSISNATNNIGIPSGWVQDFFQNGQVSGNKLPAPMFIIDISPIAFTYIRLVTHHVVILYFRSVLDSTVNHTHSRVSSKFEQTPKFEIAVGFFGNQVTIHGHFFDRITTYNHSVNDLP